MIAVALRTISRFGFLATIASVPGAAVATAGDPVQAPIIYYGEISVNTNADGGLRPALGVHNIQAYRANRTAPDHLDGLHHTYLHAPMLAYWRGRFYLDYLSAPIDEHEAPTPTSYTTSKNGIDWEAPRLLFPSYQVAEGTDTVTHQRASFYVSPNDRLLATAFHGIPPRPNDGTGIGRVVREIGADGTLGPIYFLRYNSHPGWRKENAAHYPFYTESEDAGFIEACQRLLANKLMTAQWWEEDRSEDGFYRAQGKALSWYRLRSGAVVGIWKSANTMISDDDGQTWIPTGKAENLPQNSSKYWAAGTSDGRYALVFNPTSRLRHPLAITTSDDGQQFTDLLAVHGELPVQRFPGKYKNMGPQYVRGILEENGKPPDGNLWLAYSVNKEDIWVSKVPVPVQRSVESDIEDDFSQYESGSMPAEWNVYRPIWAPVEVLDTNSEAGNALSLSDSDPYDYASVTRVFPEGRSALIRFRLRAEQADGRLEIDVASAEGLRPAQIAFTGDGNVQARHEGIWKPAGAYSPGHWINVEIDVNPGHDVDRYQLRIDGQEVLFRPAYFTDPTPTIERLTIRTGYYRRRGSGGEILDDADHRHDNIRFWIDDVRIVANRRPPEG